MKARLFAFLSLLFLAVGTLCAGDDAAKVDQKKLQGSWSLVKLVYNGTDITEKTKFRLVFKGEQITVEDNDEVKKEYAKFKFTLIGGTKPKALDVVVSAGIQKDAVIEAIFELKGDELTLCAKVFGKERPTEFSSPDGASIALVVLKREGP